MKTNRMYRGGWFTRIAAIVSLVIGGLALFTGCPGDTDPGTGPATESYTLYITVTNETEGTLTVTVDGAQVANGGSVEEGKTVTLTAAAKNGYSFVKFTITGLGTDPTDKTTSPATFTMPANDVTVAVEFEVPAGSSDVEIGIKTEADFNGLPQQAFTLSRSGTPGGTPNSQLAITLTGHIGIEWYVDGESAPAANVSTVTETGDALTLDADDWDVGPHSLTVVVTVGSLQYAKKVNFTVTR